MCVGQRAKSFFPTLCHFILSEDMRTLGCLSVSNMRLHENMLCSFLFISVSSDLKPNSCFKVRENATLFCTTPFLGSVTRCQHPKNLPFHLLQNKYVFMQTNYMKICLPVHQALTNIFKLPFLLKVVCVLIE